MQDSITCSSILRFLCNFTVLMAGGATQAVAWWRYAVVRSTQLCRLPRTANCLCAVPDCQALFCAATAWGNLCDQQTFPSSDGVSDQIWNMQWFSKGEHAGPCAKCCVKWPSFWSPVKLFEKMCFFLAVTSAVSLSLLWNFFYCSYVDILWTEAIAKLDCWYWWVMHFFCFWLPMQFLLKSGILPKTSHVCFGS